MAAEFDGVIDVPERAIQYIDNVVLASKSFNSVSPQYIIN